MSRPFVLGVALVIPLGCCLQAVPERGSDGGSSGSGGASSGGASSGGGSSGGGSTTGSGASGSGGSTGTGGGSSSSGGGTTGGSPCGGCGTGSYCAGSGQCEPDRSIGASCERDGQCLGGQCVSGVCCASACGPCGSCQTGSCEAQPADDPHHPNPACAPYLCDGVSAACPTSCSSTSQCMIGTFCNNSQCVPLI